MGFLESHPAIYEQIKWKGFAKDMQQHNIIALLARVEDAGYYWDAEKNKLTNPGFHQWTKQTPWMHQKHGTSKRCGFDHQLCFNGFGIIPPRCLECWKVCVAPHTFEQLMKLRELQKAQNVACKCGIEVRDYTPKLYGGYYYNDSLDEGYDCYEKVTQDIKEHVGDDIPIILKRGCTEFEMIKGPSPGWHMTKEEERMLTLLENYVDPQTINSEQREEVQNHVWFKWVLWAHMHGDMTYLPYNDGEKVFPDYVTYHDKDPAKMKQEMALAKANALNNADPESTKKVMGDMFDSAMKNNVDPNAILNMGGNTHNVLNMQPTIPNQVQGDHDELT